MLATRATVPTGEGWHYEAKWDGARGLIRGFDGHAEIYSRTGTHLSRSFPELCEAMPAGLNGHRAILDGEIVALDARAQPCFQRLQRRLHVARPSAALQTAVPVTLFVFDILHLDGADVTRLSYLERRALLEQLRLDQAGPRIITPPVWSDIDGDIILDVMRQAALEGVVAKRATSPYQAGRRSRFWVKTPIRNAARLVVGGWIFCAELHRMHDSSTQFQRL